MSPKLRETVQAIVDPADVALERRIRDRLDSLTKPRGSLGRLEDLALWFALCRADPLPPSPSMGVVVFCADHGVTAQGVSAYPQEVTAQMVANFSAGGAAINVLCRRLGIEATIVDVGVASALSPELRVEDRKVAPGTRDFTVDSAMTEAERDRAIEIGVEMAGALADRGITLAAAGEMGIGNTTAASALGAALTGADAELLAGPGTGVDSAGRARKVAAIRAALDRHALADRDPLRALACVGGFEIAAMAGFYLGAAARRLPVVVDGFIAASAALAAVRMEPKARPYLTFGHASAEPGHQVLLNALGGAPLLHLGMRLGEGTGAALAMGLIEAAVGLYRGMATFESAGVSDR